MPRVDAFLKLGREQGCSDIHLAVNTPPLLRLNGDLAPIKYRHLSHDELENLIYEILTEDQIKSIIDEIHTYRGILGSHVNQLILRLKRLCGHYGARPRFILLSATVSNPDEFGKSLIGEDIRVVQSVGAPRAGQKVSTLSSGWPSIRVCCFTYHWNR